MTKFKSWIVAFRLRTLPLAISSVLMGSFLAIASGSYSWLIISLSIITTLFLQILSNLANDYGDGIKGTDNNDRVGPVRTIQSGKINPNEMKIGIGIFIILSLISGVWLIIESFGSNWYLGLLFLILGLAAIASAIKYTVGNKAYGYFGFGDLFVFLFFGLLAVIGTYFLNTHSLDWEIFLPAIAIGFLSTGVLNLNNMRDMDNDSKSEKKTLALFIGYNSSKTYHTFLVTASMVLLVVFIIIQYSNPWQFIFVISFPTMIKQLVEINKQTDKTLLDPYLKKLAFSTLILTLLFGMGIIFG